MKVPYDEVDRIAKLIPGTPGTSLKESIENIADLKTLIDNSADYRRLMKLSLTLEGISRHASTHAAGMIITPTPLVNHVPLYKSNRDEITTQYDMKSIDAIGLLEDRRARAAHADGDRQGAAHGGGESRAPR